MPPYPKLATAKARKIVKDPALFARAESNLLRAIERRTPRTEQFWRKVFGAYALLIDKGGKHAVSRAVWQQGRTAFEYRTGILPPEKDRDVPF